jgi:hypothetical protein
MFPNALQKAATRRNIKLALIARTVGVDKAAVTRWNQLKTPAARLEALKDNFGIEPWELRPDLHERPGAKRKPAALPAA